MFISLTLTLHFNILFIRRIYLSSLDSPWHFAILKMLQWLPEKAVAIPQYNTTWRGNDFGDCVMGRGNQQKEETATIWSTDASLEPGKYLTELWMNVASWEGERKRSWCDDGRSWTLVSSIHSFHCLIISHRDSLPWTEYIRFHTRLLISHLFVPFTETDL